MKPTLYAEDLDILTDTETRERFARVLPRNCPAPILEVIEQHRRCHLCDGAGFLYPDPPDWMWEGALGGMTWESF